MRKKIVLVCIALQVFFLAAMVYSRESIVYTGDRIVLRTSPIDPRDPFRGDYVRLQFAINNVLNYEVRWATEKDKPVAGDKVYAVLAPIVGGVNEAEYFTNEKPDVDELFITGRLQFDWEYLKNPNNLMRARNVKFGIEQLFVEQGEGISIEKRQGLRGGVQVPMMAELAVGSNGVAVLDGYHWSPLGVEIAPNVDALSASVNAAGEAAPRGRAVNPHLKVDIVNVSDNMMLIRNPLDLCGITMEPAQAFQSEYEQVIKCNAEEQTTMMTLAPAERITLKINLLDQRWFIKPKTGDITTARAVSNREMVRFVYHSSVAMSNEDGKEVWLGELSSRAISMQGRID